MIKIYRKEEKKQKIEELMAKLPAVEDDEEKTKEILREIEKLQKG